MDKIALLNQIRLNGIDGVDGIIDMIIDTIDDGDKEGAKDWLRQLKDEIYEAVAALTRKVPDRIQVFYKAGAVHIAAE